MKCKFCFATFQDVKSTILPKGHLSRDESLEIVDEIIKGGYQKITFAGGEPTLCPWLSKLIIRAKKGGLTTMLVTNGARLSKKFLDEVDDSLDWITLSIDSINQNTLIETGRMERKGPMSEEEYLKIATDIHSRKKRLKLNTVVTSINCEEDLSEFVIKMKPERWKIMQVLPVTGQNDNQVQDLLISKVEFENYLSTNSVVKDKHILIVPENNDQMKESYVMIDPAGRFFDNVDESYYYSQPILKVGIDKAFKQIRINTKKFIDRDGIYDWD